MFRLAVVCGLVLIYGSWSFSAEEVRWTDLLSGNKLDAFKPYKTKENDWVFAESVTVDPNKSNRLVAKPGKGILVNHEKGRSPNLYTKEDYVDVELHLEFMIPKGSNAGVKFHGVYEIQILDSYGSKKELTGSDCGGIYPRADTSKGYGYLDKGVPPKVNACKAPGEWQTLDVIWISPRFDAEGKKIANAKVLKAKLNDQLIHENVEVLTPTGSNHMKKEVAKGPIMFQGDHGPIAVRSFKVRPYKVSP